MATDYDAKIARFVDSVRKRVAEREPAPGAQRSIVKYRLKTVMKQCGWKKRGKDNLQRIQCAFEPVGPFPQPELTAEDIGVNSWIYFSKKRTDTLRQEPQQLFPKEQGLERFIIANLDRIRGLEGLEFEMRQAPVRTGHIDVLCRDRESGDYVVLELKRSDTDHRVIGQMAAYMNSAEKRYAKPKGVGIRGIIITGQPNAALQEALHHVDYDISWMTYEIEMKVAPARLTT